VTSEFRSKLAERVRRAGVTISAAELALQEKYFDLLVRWNRRINLTSLPLEPVQDATIDRMFLEPIVAARHVPDSPLSWLDIGSGGGSPAIPLKIMRPQARLTMIESRAKKAAFLREAARVLELTDTQVRETRFEASLEGPDRAQSRADLITVRAIRSEPAFMSLCRRALAPGGRLLLFQSTPEGSVQNTAGLNRLETVQLAGTTAFLDVLEAV
jgi:16S rRNA (guanine527-N7)-methyltransferase